MSLFAYPLGGWLSDKWEAKRPGGRMLTAAIMTASAGISAILYFYFAFFLYSGPLAWSPLLLIGLFFAILYPIFCTAGAPVSATTQMVVPVHRRSLSYGVGMTSMYLLGGGWGSGIAGMIADHVGTGKPGDWVGLAYGTMIVCSAGILGGLCWWRSAYHYKTDIKKVQQ